MDTQGQEYSNGTEPGAMPALGMPAEGSESVKPTLRKDDLAGTERANLAASMTPEMQKTWARKTVDRHTRDVASRADRMKKLKDLQKMYALVAEPKNFPFHKAANVKTPALTGPELQIQARLFDMVWPASGKIFNVIPGTAQDAAIAHKAEQFSNSYVRYKMPYMAQGLDDTLHQMCLYGSSFRRTYWDAYEVKVRSDWLPMENVVVAYAQRSQDPSMSDVPRYTIVHDMTLGDIEKYSDDGIYINAAEVKAHRSSEVSGGEFREQSDRVDGVSPDTDDEDMPRQVLEQHCRWKLPNQPAKHPAFDGKEHYVVVTVDATSEKVLRISLREEDDPDDKRRFDREMARYQQYQMQLLTYQAAIAAPPPLPPMAPDVAMGMQPVDPPDTTMPPLMGAAPLPVPLSPPPPPAPPEPVEPPRQIRRRQICFLTHFRCFPSDGFYGIGYGDLLYGLAVAMNTILNQHIDGVTLKNAKPMFMSRQVRMQRGAVNVQPGEVVEVDGPVSNIREAIMFLDPPQNDPTTVPLVKMLDQMKDTMVGSSDLMSGQVPGSNQTKAGMQILAEQMMAPISVLGRRVREAFRHELEKIWRCFGVFLEDDDIADVVTESGAPEEVKVGKWMFTPNARLVPASDSRMKSQRIEDHMQLFQYAMQNPIISQNPQVGGPILSKLTEEGFRIFPDGEKLIPFLQPPQPPPPQPKPQFAENAGFMKGEDSPVHPDDDDDQHMQETMMFMQSPDAQMMDQKGRQMAERHLRGHASQRMMKKGQQLEQLKSQFAGAGGQGPPGVAPGAGQPPPPPAFA